MSRLFHENKKMPGLNLQGKRYKYDLVKINRNFAGPVKGSISFNNEVIVHPSVHPFPGYFGG